MPDPQTTPGRAAPARTTNALEKWAAEAGSPQAAAPPEVRLDQNERLLVPFTPTIQAVELHYLDYAALRGYIRCNGGGCVLCRIGRKAETRDLLPVYDPTARAVAVLPVPANLRPQALKPQLLPVLKRVASDERLLLAVRKLDSYRYAVEPLPLPEEADDGAEQIAEFLRRFAAGELDLAAVYQQLSNECLAELPEVAIILKLRGLTP